MATDNLNRNPEELVCDKIKLSDFSELQAYGTLLIIDNKDLKVLQYSENACELLAISKNDLLSRPITDYLIAKNASLYVKEWITTKDKQYEQFILSHGNQKNICIYIHQQSEFIVLEIEVVEDSNPENIIFASINELINLRSDVFLNDINIFSKIICTEVRRITDYDRVTLYKFENDDSGIVLGEAIKDQMESYVGLRFPATDVPYYVRAMYLSQPLRYIPTVDYKPVQLISSSSKNNIKIDLSNIMLRSVSPIHIEYVKNMGASSALSVGIVNDNKLWGLISCQHNKPKFLSVYYRFGLLFLSNALSRQLITIHKNLEYNAKDTIFQMQELIHAKIKSSEALYTAFENIQDDLLNMFSSDGIALFYQDKLYLHGETPAEKDVKNIIFWLFDNQEESVFYTHRLSKQFLLAKAFNKIASGVLAILLTPDEKNYLLLFRKELITTVSWAGNPNDVLTEKGKTYSPRNSFKLWTETVRDQSKEWEKYEIFAAKSLQTILESKQLEILLLNQAQKDTLTGLYNRRTLKSNLQHELLRTKRNNKELAVFILDVDFFKKVNDEFGHSAGDFVLVKIGEVLQKVIRTYDYVYRYGGEEFLLIFPEISSEFVTNKTEEILENIRNLKLQYENTPLPKITISIGIAIFPQDSEEPEKLINLADEALYKAKSQGRDRAVRI